MRCGQAQLLAVLVCISGPQAFASPPERLEFQLFSPCGGNACADTLLLSGVIDAEAPERLEDYLEELGYTPDIAFNSPGGNLIAGMELGALIRRRGADTWVSRQYVDVSSVGRPKLIAENAICMSACAYAFMGGVGRSVGDDAAIGVHQFSGDVSAETSQAITQITGAVLSQYVKGMGVDRDVLDVASLTLATDMAPIDRNSANQFNLDNQSPALSPWDLRAGMGGQLVLTVEQQRSGRDDHVRVALVRNPARADLMIVAIAFDVRAGVSGEMLTSAADDGVDAEVKLCNETSSLCVPMALNESWKYQKYLGFSAIYMAPSAELFQLANSADRIRLNLTFARVFSDLVPNVEFATIGFRDGLLALLR